MALSLLSLLLLVLVCTEPIAAAKEKKVGPDGGLSYDDEYRKVISKDPDTGDTIGEWSVQVISLYAPPDCRTKQNPTAKRDQYAQLSYVAAIDQSSESGLLGYAFDHSKPGFPIAFQIGNVTHSSALPGLHSGVEGLCQGQKAALVIPPALGFGPNVAKFPSADVPPNATLRYEVEMLKVSSEMIETAVPNVFAEVDKNADGAISRHEMYSYFTQQGRHQPPKGLWKKLDVNGDDKIDWHEFDGPKGDSPYGTSREEPDGDEDKEEL